jgi:8-oxo-dGTP diphosphatase
MNERMITVVAGIVRKGNQTLIAQRNKDSFLEQSLWEFPGGKIEFGEEPEECLKRELKEELNISISVDKIFAVKSHVYEKNEQKIHVLLLFYLANFVGGEISCVACQDFAWITKNDLHQYAFVRADISVVEKYFSSS